MSKERRQTYDLTEGDIFRKLLLVALPIIGTQLLQMSYNLVDMFLLGRVGSDAVAASGSAGMYLWLSNGLMLIGRMGAEIGVSQQIGMGNRGNAQKYAQNSFFIAIILGIVYGAFCFFGSGPAIGFFGIREAHVAQDAQQYLQIVALAMPFAFINAVVVGCFNGSGNSRVPFLINAVGLVINAGLDPIFIFTLDMGVLGAAIATSIAQVVVCLLALLAIHKSESRPFSHFTLRHRPEGFRIRQILKWSLPVGGENILFTFFSMLISRMVAGYGAHAIAAQRVGSQIESLCWMVCIGFSTAVTAFVGQNYGAGKADRIHAGVRRSYGVLCAWGVVVTLLLLFAAEPLFTLFLPDAQALPMGVAYLHILAIAQISGCLEAVSSGAFRGVGDTLPPSIASIASNGGRVILCYVLSAYFLGVDGIWWGVSIGALVRGVWIFLWHRKKFPHTA